LLSFIGRPTEHLLLGGVYELVRMRNIRSAASPPIGIIQIPLVITILQLTVCRKVVQFFLSRIAEG
jgi:hypothetical protein